MEPAKTQPKVSILIPVYNTAGYLPKCLASVQNQTLKEIEIIVVNDASPDNAAEVLADYAARDSRIKVITHEKNGGILEARRSGIAAAKGEYLIFLDADDYLNTDTARACYAKAKKTGADMIHFCFDVRVGHRKKTRVTRNVERRINPYHGTLLGKEVFEGAFVHYLYRWNIVGKCIAAEVCRKAAAALPPGYYIMAEDFCFYTMMSWFARHYEPLFKKCYYYGLDIGVSSYTILDFKGLLRNCSVFTALAAVKSFLSAQGIFKPYQAAFEDQERKILQELLDRWEHKLIQSDRQRALKYMFSHYSPAGLLRALVGYFSGRENDLACLMGKTAWVPRHKTDKQAISNLGLYLEKAVIGEEMTEWLLRCAADWRKAGRQVTVISPDEVKTDLPRILIPAGLAGTTAEQRIARIGFWENLREKYQIDTVIHGAAENPAALFDALSIRFFNLNLMSLQMRGYHSLASSSLGKFIAQMRTVSLSDAVGVTAAEDLAFYSSLLPCRLLKPSCPAQQKPGCAAGSGNQLIWLGDFGGPDAEEVIFAWAHLAAEFPEYRLCMVGFNPPQTAEHRLVSLAECLGIYGKLEFRTITDDFHSLLKEGRVLFTTSGRPVRIYTERASELGIPVLESSGLAPEELSAELADCLSGRRPFPDRQELPGNSPDDPFDWSEDTQVRSGFPAADVLETLNRCSMNVEPYVVMPKPQGDSFAPIYRGIDRLTYSLLPGDSPRRHVVFRLARYILRKLEGKQPE